MNIPKKSENLIAGTDNSINEGSNSVGSTESSIKNEEVEAIDDIECDFSKDIVCTEAKSKSFFSQKGEGTDAHINESSNFLTGTNEGEKIAPRRQAKDRGKPIPTPKFQPCRVGRMFNDISRVIEVNDEECLAKKLEAEKVEVKGSGTWINNSVEYNPRNKSSLRRYQVSSLKSSDKEISVGKSNLNRSRRRRFTDSDCYMGQSSSLKSDIEIQETECLDEDVDLDDKFKNESSQDVVPIFNLDVNDNLNKVNEDGNAGKKSFFSNSKLNPKSENDVVMKSLPQDNVNLLPSSVQSSKRDSFICK